ncbi:aminoacyl-tRNA hydrolase [Kineosporia sp. A_224]|uniref:aminoacyl-tRNA hydrolase n=1 Tax=Kineosporia sp. A_224 TaxID=1962180 RepID=UPI001E4173AF|nr:aminoacyl-tRNA hydrolase [Kineosporia sp. A_224]
MNDPAVAGGDPDAVWLVVGLGNPGPKYAGNRHNVGAMALDAVAAELGARFSAHRSRAEVSEVRLPPVGGRPGPRAVLAKPSSYMNESGGPVSGLVKFFKIPAANVLVVHDELDLPFGEVRLKRGGGEAGHNGLRSISQSLGTKDYCRVRVGVGRPPGRQDPADFVLKDFPSSQREEVALLVGDAADAALDVLRQGWERAQGAVNTVRR